MAIISNTKFPGVKAFTDLNQMVYMIASQVTRSGAVTVSLFYLYFFPIWLRNSESSLMVNVFLFFVFLFCFFHDVMLVPNLFSFVVSTLGCYLSHNH